MIESISILLREEENTRIVVNRRSSAVMLSIESMETATEKHKNVVVLTEDERLELIYALGGNAT